MAYRDRASRRATAQGGLISWLRAYWPATLIIVALCLSAWGEWSTAQKQQNEKAPTATKQIPLEIPWPDAGGWTAIFTGLLTVSTVLLWRSTHNLWRAAKDELETTERAFVYIDGFNTEVSTGAIAGLGDMPAPYRDRRELYLTRFAFAPRWKNSGTTPVRRMTIKVSWGQCPPNPIPPEYNYPEPAVSFVLGPSATEASDVVEVPPARSLIDYGAFRIGNPSEILIWGRAEYEDIFTQSHFVQWCYKLRFDMYDGERLRASFIQWGDYNRTDDDARD